MDFSSNIEWLEGRAYLAVPRFESHLYSELEEGAKLACRAPSILEYGSILYVDEPPHHVFWKHLTLEAPFIARFKSIGEASSILKSMQRNWALKEFRCIRRSHLIKEKLPFISEKPREFPYRIPTSPMGIFTLLDEHTMLASAKTSSSLPLGAINFMEDKIAPPSRAYLKLYEALCLLDYYKRLYSRREEGLFGSKEKVFSDLLCIDAGASPGGWSWVLKSLGAHIIAIDRSPLAPHIMQSKQIEFITHDAFTLSPQSFGKVDWVFSDVVCYPTRLLSWVHKWLEAGLCDNFLCTLKMQGKPDMQSIRAFAQISNSHIVHLSYNKHELTFIRSPSIFG